MLESASIELVIMDLAGTTVEDPDGVGQALKSALTEAGVPWNHESVNGIMGIPKPIAIRQLWAQVNPGMTADDGFFDAIHADFKVRMMDYYRNDPTVKEVPGATQVFKTLRAGGIKVGLDTGFSRDIVDVLMTRLGWSADLVDASATSDEVPRGRPYPDLVLRVMELTGVTDVKRVAKVGDTPSDLGEGTAAGCGWVIGVTEGTHTADQLRPHPHTHVISSVRDLPALFGVVG